VVLSAKGRYLLSYRVAGVSVGKLQRPSHRLVYY
jgi:hypothetical protein